MAPIPKYPASCFPELSYIMAVWAGGSLHNSVAIAVPMGWFGLGCKVTTYQVNSSQVNRMGWEGRGIGGGTERGRQGGREGGMGVDGDAHIL